MRASPVSKPSSPVGSIFFGHEDTSDIKYWPAILAKLSKVLVFCISYRYFIDHVPLVEGVCVLHEALRPAPATVPFCVLWTTENFDHTPLAHSADRKESTWNLPGSADPVGRVHVLVADPEVQTPQLALFQTYPASRSGERYSSLFHTALPLAKAIMQGPGTA